MTRPRWRRRRLCYGHHQGQERLFLSHASERRLWGGMREPAVPSVFLSELPEALVQGTFAPEVLPFAV